MKKYLFMAVAGMLALSSCSNDSDELVVKDAPQTMTFTAGYADGVASRAAISGTSVTWETGDAIKVFSTKNSTGANFTTSNTGATATFTGTAVADSKFYAVYPATGTSLDGTTIKGLCINQNQSNSAWFASGTTATSGLDTSSAFAVAVADPGHALQFKCICAILKVTLTPGSAFGDKVTVKVQANETMAATFDYKTAEGTYQKVGEGSNYVQTSDLVDVTSGPRTVYLKILPGTYNGFKLTSLNANNYSEITKNKSSVTFQAGKVYDLGTFTVGVDGDDAHV